MSHVLAREKYGNLLWFDVKSIVYLKVRISNIEDKYICTYVLEENRSYSVDHSCFWRLIWTFVADSDRRGITDRGAIDPSNPADRRKTLWTRSISFHLEIVFWIWMIIELEIELNSKVDEWARSKQVTSSMMFHWRLTICQNYQFYLNLIYSGNQNFRCKQGTIHSLYEGVLRRKIESSGRR